MTYTTFTLRILLSLVLGFFIGLERQITGHPAGIRINILICMGTCFYTLSDALRLGLGIPCRQLHYFRCWLSLQRCDF